MLAKSGRACVERGVGLASKRCYLAKSKNDKDGFWRNRMPTTGKERTSVRAELDGGKVTVKAHDGKDYKLRSIRPADAESLTRGYAAMSNEAKHFRMLYKVPELTPEMAARFCSPDPSRDYCVVVEGRDALEGEILGGARIMGIKEGQSAQVSVSLRPEAEGKGLAKAALVTVLRVAAEMGVKSVWGVIVTDNKPMIALARNLGFALVENPDDSSETLARLDLPVRS